MKRKLNELIGLLLIVLVFAALIWLPPLQRLILHPAGEDQASTATPGLEVNLSDDAQMIKDTLVNALKIYDNAAYTFDTSQFAEVYINDPRGGGSLDSLVSVQELRQDPTLQRDQVGMLEGMQAGIEIRKRNYDKIMAELRAKEANGSLSPQEKFILDGESYGYPTSTPTWAGPSPAPTLPCLLPIQPTSTPRAAYIPPNPNLPPTDYPEPVQSPGPTVYPPPSTTTMPPATAYPPPNTTPLPTANSANGLVIDPTDYPRANAVALPTPGAGMVDPSQYTRCATATPRPSEPGVYFIGRGPNPETIPPENYNIDIQSIKIDGEVARAVVQMSKNVIVEDVLVKVNGKWYIAGLNILKDSF